MLLTSAVVWYKAMQHGRRYSTAQYDVHHASSHLGNVSLCLLLGCVQSLLSLLAVGLYCLLHAHLHLLLALRAGDVRNNKLCGKG